MKAEVLDLMKNEMSQNVLKAFIGVDSSCVESGATEVVNGSTM